MVSTFNCTPPLLIDDGYSLVSTGENNRIGGVVFSKAITGFITILLDTANGYPVV
jgi:hypothetical protein